MQIATSKKYYSQGLPIDCSLELVCTCTRFGHQDPIICSCYHPPQSSTFCDFLHHTLNNVVRHANCAISVLGDLNFSDLSYGTALIAQLSDITAFINLCYDFNFADLVKEPTRTISSSPNVLDFILTTQGAFSTLIYLPRLSEYIILHSYYSESCA